MYRKEGLDYLEYRIIPAREEVVRRMSQTEFAALETSLKAQVMKDPKAIGDTIIAGKQKLLDEILVAKTAAEVKPEPIEP